MRQSNRLEPLYNNELITAKGKKMVVYKLVEDANFATMYGPRGLGEDLEKLCVTAAQREAFYRGHADKLSEHGATFFLHKRDEAKPATPENLEVAYMYSGGLCVVVFRHFVYERVWYADDQPRVVVPQLVPQ